MNRKQAKELCDSFLKGNYSNEEGATILIDLAEKGETPDEIAGFSDSLIANASPFPNRTEVFDLCGTGGSTVDRFNVSTSVAFILAAAGIKVAKHGNKGSRKTNGSFDLLEELDIEIDLDGEELSELLDETNLSFVYARKFHDAMKNVVKARKIANRRTIFNLAGPISNPANVTAQLIGTIDAKDIDRMIEVMTLLKRKKASVVSGFPEIDEASVSGESLIATYIKDRVTRLTLNPEEIGMNQIEYNTLPCGLADVNAKEFKKLIEGEGNIGIEAMVILNTAVSLYTIGAVDKIEDGINEAHMIIRQGKMKEQFFKYKWRAKDVKDAR